MLLLNYVLWLHTLLTHAVVGATLTSADGFPWGSLHCPEDANGTLPTPTYGSEDRVWMICTELLIRALPEAIYETLIDFERYHLWNSFVIDVALPANVTKTPADVYVGMDMVFTTVGLYPDVNTTSDEVVTVLSHDPRAGYLMAAWRSNVYINETLSPAEHPSILTAAGDGNTRYVSYETYYEGPATSLILPLKPQLEALFYQQGLDLKAYVEGLNPY